eukprot:g24198.t1
MLHFTIEDLRVFLKCLLCPLGARQLGIERLLGESRVGHVDNVPSPWQPIKTGQYLDADDISLVEDTGVGGLPSQWTQRVLCRQCWWNCSRSL